MAWIMNPMPEHDISCDVSTNPEILLMAAEQDEAECDATTSLWLAGRAVTKPKSSDYKE